MGEFVMRKSYDLFHVPKVSKYPNWEQKLGDAKKFVTVLYQGLSVIAAQAASAAMYLTSSYWVLTNFFSTPLFYCISYWIYLLVVPE